MAVRAGSVEDRDDDPPELATPKAESCTGLVVDVAMLTVMFVDALDALDRRGTQDDLEDDAYGADDHGGDHYQKVLEQYAEREQNDTERRQGVEAT